MVVARAAPVASGAVGIAIVDPAGRVREANDSFLTLLGVTRDALESGRVSWHPIAPRAAARTARRRVDTVVRDGRAATYRTRLQRPNGAVMLEVTLSRISSRPPALACQVVDLSRPSSDLKTLRRREARLRAVVESAIDGILTLSAGGVIESSNLAAEKLLGRSSAELVGAELGCFLHAGGEPTIPTELITHEKPGRTPSIGLSRPVTAIHGDGTRTPLLLTLSEVEIEGGPRFTAILHDDSQHQRLDEERLALLARERSAREEAERLNRAKDEFVATLSHELRTPLNSIVLWTDCLREGDMSSEEVSTAVDAIERNARVQARLVNDVLEMSRIVMGKSFLRVRPMDAHATVLAAVETLAPTAAAKSVRLESRLRDVGTIVADPDRVEQIVWNLVSNAIKFTASGGRILVDLGTSGSEVVLRVRDDGAGIAPGFLPHVFDRFRQQDGGDSREHSGIGLGLAIVKHFVELHGGRVEAASAGIGRGATFTVRLPWRRPAAGTAASTDQLSG